jgi:hypothetical protein
MFLLQSLLMSQASRPREDWYDGPFFAVGKAIGDKRAIVAEKAFNKWVVEICM